MDCERSAACPARDCLFSQRRVLPAIAYLEGEYGFEGIYLGVPTILGKDGIEEVIELDLKEEEKKALEKSASSVREVMKVLQ